MSTVEAGTEKCLLVREAQRASVELIRSGFATAEQRARMHWTLAAAQTAESLSAAT